MLLAAKSWGIPPWEVEDGPARWFVLWEQEENIRNTIANNKIPPDMDMDDY